MTKKAILPIVLAAAAVAFAGDGHGPSHAAPAPVAPAVTPDQALEQLREGNDRFVANDVSHPHANQERRCETFAGGQHPVATVLSCSDSRVPPELLFDSGIGDLFVVRVAGNVADTDEIATIEYGAAHLKTPLIVVMGHVKCGAVTAVVDGADVHGNLPGLLKKIKPAAADARDANPDLKGSPLVAKAIRANVFQAMQDVITHSDDVAGLLKSKQVKLVGAIYDLHSGNVQWLGEHPRQAELISEAAKLNKAEEHTDAADDDHKPAKKTVAMHDANEDDHKPAAKKPAADDHAPTKKSAAHDDDHAPAKPAKKTKAAAKDEGHDAHSAAPSAPAAVAQTPVQRYGPIAGLAVGALSLGMVMLQFTRR